MMRAKRPILASALAATLFMTSAMPAYAQIDGSAAINNRPGEVAMFFDATLARPTLIGATLLGTAMFAVTLPFSALGGNTYESAEHLVKVPARAAFVRCMGCTPIQHERLKAEKELEKSRKVAATDTSESN